MESESGRISLFATAEGESGTTVQGLTFAFDDSHILYSKLRPYLNKVALPTFSGRCSTELIPLLPAKGIDREYLAFYLRRDAIATEVMRESTGSRMPRADMSKLFELEIPVPPLVEQRQIALHLKHQLAAAAEAREAAEVQLNTLRTLPAALLKWVFEPVKA